MSVRLFIGSLIVYGGGWVRSWLPGAQDAAPLGARRLVFLMILFPAGMLLQLIHWLGHGLDECLFPRHRDVEIREPLFITGIPRSGTTFWHRTLAINTDAFTTFRAWEAVLAPSICERRVLRALSAADGMMGRPVRRAIDHLLAWLAGDFQAVHEVGCGMPEEDYLALLPGAGCFLMALAFPFERRWWDLADLDRLPPEQRDRCLRFYRRTLQKHLYAEGRGRRLLSKNAAFASWAPFFPELFPGARFIVCVREPEAALRSQLSSLKSGRELFGTDPTGEVMADRFRGIYERNYARLAGWARRMPPERLAVVDMEALRQHPGPVLRQVKERLDVPGHPALEEEIRRLERMDAPHRSGHGHAPDGWRFDKSDLDAWMGEAYRELNGLPVAIRTP